MFSVCVLTASVVGAEDDDQPKLSGIGLGEIHTDFVSQPIIVRRISTGELKPFAADLTDLNMSSRMVIDSNQALLSYFQVICFTLYTKIRMFIKNVTNVLSRVHVVEGFNLVMHCVLLFYTITFEHWFFL